MNKLISLALVATVAGGLFAVSPSFARDSDVCGPNGPEGYKRPGGYCDQLKEKASLAKSDKQHWYGFNDF